MLRRWTAFVTAILLAGCQPTVRLMPPPAVFATGEHSPFAVNPSLEKSNRLQVFYATNRLPLGPREARIYSILAGPTLYLGTATVRIGPAEKSWESLYSLSTRPAEAERPILSLERLDELATIKGSEAADVVTPEARQFFAAVNAALGQSLDKDLTIYVHGANTNMEVASAQAAQFRHFTGRNAVVLVFAWPSAESGIRYFTDVQNARLSVPVFARLIDLLGRHTKAEHINVLAYSAGSQVVSPGLVALRGLRRANGSFRLGEVYFAAPDVAFRAFATHLPHYVDLARRITVSVNLDDAVLGISQRFQGISRLGKPDPSELSEEETRRLIEASRYLNFDVISVEPEVIPGLSRRSHSYWYDHPWVSSDVMIKLLFHTPPDARGLQPRWTARRFRFWTFPPDYDRRVNVIMRKLRVSLFGPQADQGKAGTHPPDPREPR